MGRLKKYSSTLLLPLLTLIYVVGELGHFLIGVVSRSVAQNIGYGDKSCLVIQSLDEIANSKEYWDFCKEYGTESGCALAQAEFGGENKTEIQPCEWNYNGLGTGYQVLAGPSYMACFTIVGVIWGVIADKTNRVYLLGGATIGCGAAIVGTAFATQYWHLVLFRMALAAGAAACTPLAAGMLADVFPENKRALAMGVFNCGIYFGYGGSFAVGSYITDTTLFNEAWRTCFLVSGIPGIIIAVLFLLTVDEPRGKNETNDMPIEMKNPVGIDERKDLENFTPTENESVQSSVMKLLTRVEIPLLVVAACIRHSAGYCWGYNSALYYQTYYPDFDAGWWLTGISIGAGVLGCILGGFISDRLVKRLGISARTLVLGTSQLISTPFTVALFYLPPPYSFLALFFAIITSEMWFGVMYAILVELVPANFKSTAVAITLFVINNAGGNLPILVGPLTHATDYRTALLILDPGALFASSLLFFVCWALLRRMTTVKN